jgi:uncharacterized SAM-binding protein YcdF (DUF218 family)
MSGDNKNRRRMRRALLALGVLLAVILIPAGAWFVIDGGRFLQHEDPLEHADAIFILDGTRMERPLEAVALYKEGWAPRIIISPGRTEPAETLIRSEGIRFPRESDLVRDAMIQLGVPASAIMPVDGYVDNTSQEANLLRAMVKVHGWRRVIIVTSKYHTRRAHFAFRRGLENTGAVPIIRATRYDLSDPAHWLRSRADFRFASSEWVKLIGYRLGF